MTFPLTRPRYVVATDPAIPGFVVFDTFRQEMVDPSDPLGHTADVPSWRAESDAEEIATRLNRDYITGDPRLFAVDDDGGDE